MKYFFMVLAVMLSLSSCAMYDDSSLPNFNSLEDAVKWINTNIDYESDLSNYGYTEYWANPKEVLERRRGDCDDMAILLLYAAKTQFHIEGSLLSINLSKYSDKYHAICYIGDQYYDACWNSIGWNGGYGTGKVTYNYGTTMIMAYSNYKF
jgi:hypothetical protein